MISKRTALVSASILSASIIALSSVALAADMAPRYVKAVPPLEPPAWAGWYAGLQGGAADIESTFSDLGGGGDFGISNTGGVFGGNAGYNWQSGNVVWGMETDINWVGAKASASYFGGTAIQTAEVSWMGSFRGRVGVDYMATLFYVTGGVAYGGVNNSATGFGPADFAESGTRVGWTAGVGVEHLFANHLTARAEVRYTDLGSDTVNVDGNRGKFSNQLWTGVVGLGYKF